MEKKNKAITNGEIRALAFALMDLWPKTKGQIKLSGLGIYALTALRKEVDMKVAIINDSFRQIGEAHGGTPTEEGGLKIPDDQIEEVNKLLTEIAVEENSLDYYPIPFGENDFLPPDLMDILFEFLEVK